VAEREPTPAGGPGSGRSGDRSGSDQSVSREHHAGTVGRDHDRVAVVVRMDLALRGGRHLHHVVDHGDRDPGDPSALRETGDDPAGGLGDLRPERVRSDDLRGVGRESGELVDGDEMARRVVGRVDLPERVARVVDLVAGVGVVDHAPNSVRCHRRGRVVVPVDP